MSQGVKIGGGVGEGRSGCRRRGQHGDRRERARRTYWVSMPAVYAMTQLECEEELPLVSVFTRISSTEGSSEGMGEAMVKNESISGGGVVER